MFKKKIIAKKNICNIYTPPIPDFEICSIKKINNKINILPMQNQVEFEDFSNTFFSFPQTFYPSEKAFFENL